MTIHRFLLLILAVLILNGCGYRFTASDKHSDRRTVWVNFIGNTSNSSTAQTLIKRVLLDELQAFRGMMPASDSSSSDLVVSGNLKTYGTRAVSYTSADQIREYRLTIDVEIDVRDRTSQTVIWKGLLSAFQDFPAVDPRNPNLALQKNAEEAALEAVSRKVAQSLITSMEASY